MDDQRFDQLTRALAGATTRRGALAALAGVAGVGLAGRAADAKKKKRCDPACADGQTCRQGACICDNGGAVCGAACCRAGQRCEAGACVDPAPTCIPAGEPCKDTGRPCCDGHTCASGQGGRDDIACYVPAGGACATTADCVYDSTCEAGACVAIPRPPEPTGCACTLCADDDPAAAGERLREMAADPAGPTRITLCPGVYRPKKTIVIGRELELIGGDGGETVIDGGWSGGSATDGRMAIMVNPPAVVAITGIAIRNGYRGVGLGGCMAVYDGASVTLADVTFSACKGQFGGALFNGGTLEMTGCTITDCSAVLNSGGIDNAGVLTISGSSITNCTSGQNGGAIANTIDGSLTISDTAISGCSATGDGGGILSSGANTGPGASVTLGSGTVISGNTASGTGNGVVNGSNSTITCSGSPAAKVCANPASGSDGCSGVSTGSGCGSVCASTC